MGPIMSLQYSSYTQKNPSRLRRFVAPLIDAFSRKDLSYTIAERRSALYHLERLFDTRWHGPLPRAPLVFRPPVSGPVAEEFIHEDDPIRAFRDRGPVGWQRGLQAYFNGWKVSSVNELRMAALAHEFAHLLFAQAVLKNKTPTFDPLAYTCAAEGIATYAERDWLKSSGYVTPLLKKAWKSVKETLSSLVEKFRKPEPKPGPEEAEVDAYLLGTRFFEAVSGKVGVPHAFHLISSNLPRDMDEIYHPSIYTYRVLGEYC